MIIEHLPPYLLLSLTELGLLLIGYLVERHYVSRVTVFSNALALNVHLLSLQSVSGGLNLFADFAIGFGVVMLAFYLLQRSAPHWFYLLAMYPMSSIIIGIIIWSPLEPWYANLVLGVLAQMAHRLLVDHPLTYEGELSGQLFRFVHNTKLSFWKHGTYWEVDLDLTTVEHSPWWLEAKE